MVTPDIISMPTRNPCCAHCTTSGPGTLGDFHFHHEHPRATRTPSPRCSAPVSHSSPERPRRHDADFSLPRTGTRLTPQPFRQMLAQSPRPVHTLTRFPYGNSLSASQDYGEVSPWNHNVSIKRTSPCEVTVFLHLRYDFPFAVANGCGPQFPGPRGDDLFTVLSRGASKWDYSVCSCPDDGSPWWMVLPGCSFSLELVWHWPNSGPPPVGVTPARVRERCGVPYNRDPDSWMRDVDHGGQRPRGEDFPLAFAVTYAGMGIDTYSPRDNPSQVEELPSVFAHEFGHAMIGRRAPGHWDPRGHSPSEKDLMRGDPLPKEAIPSRDDRCAVASALDLCDMKKCCFWGSVALHRSSVDRMFLG